MLKWEGVEWSGGGVGWEWSGVGVGWGGGAGTACESFY